MNARGLVLSVFAAVLGVLVFAVPAFAAAPEAPKTEPPTEVKATTALLRGVLDPLKEGEPGAFELGSYEFVYRQSATECEGAGEVRTPEGLSLGGGKEEVAQGIEGLAADTQYTVCLVAHNEAKSAEAVGSRVTFTTAIPPEAPANVELVEGKGTSLKVSGVLNPKAPGDAGSFEFLYKRSAAECEGEGAVGGSSTGVEGELVQGEATGLLPHTTYAFCLRARNEAGEESPLSTPPVVFTTLVAAPSIEEASVSDIASSSATLSAMVNPQGAQTSYVFEVAPSGGAFAPVAQAEGAGNIPEGTAGVAVSVHLQGLQAGEAYQFRVVVANSAERVTGGPVSFATQTVGAFTLPDGRQWEMVSPPSKQGSAFLPPGRPGVVNQAANSGSAMTYVMATPTEPGVAGYANAQSVLSTRSSQGWSSRDLASGLNGSVGVSVEVGYEYRFFSEDLSQGVLAPFGAFLPCESSEGKPLPCLSPHASEQTANRRTLLHNGNPLEPCTSECFRPLVVGCPKAPAACPAPVREYANTPDGTIFGAISYFIEGIPCPPEHFCGPFPLGASPDAQHIIVHSGVQLTSEPAPEGGLYEWNANTPPASQLKLIAAGFHASLGTGDASVEDGENARHAVSEDGSRVLYTTPEDLSTLFMRDVPKGETLSIAPEGTLEVGFQLASRDGSRVFFTDREGFFVCDVVEGAGGKLECHLTQLEGPGLQGVVPVVGGSEDGSTLYYVTSGNKLYMDHFDGSVWHKTLITTLSAEDLSDWGDARNLVDMTARVSPDGRWLAFMSRESLTGYDNQDVSSSSGEPDEELFLYDSQTGRLSCASCNPTGARPTGVEIGGANGTNQFIKGERVWENNSALLAADVPGWVDVETFVSRYQPRYLSDDGRLFFDSFGSLVSKDINGTWDVYEYEPEGVGGEGSACGPGVASGSVVFKPARHFKAGGGEGEEGAGCVGLISSGESQQESVFLDASETGSDVFFLTTARLAPQDYDVAYNVYDAHECTVGSPCVTPPASLPPSCVTADACRAAPSLQPAIYGAPSSATFSGIGNVTGGQATTLSRPGKKVSKTVRCGKAGRGSRKGGKGRCVKRKRKKVRRASINRRAK